MDNVIDFLDYGEPDMDRAQLLDYLESLKARLAELDAREPKNMNSPAYEEWGDSHEELEDLVDEVLDRLDEAE